MSWELYCPTPSLRTDAQLSQCSWPTDKWEKIVQFELVVSSRSEAFQINERLPQVWQEIFLMQSWETGRYHGNPLAMPSIRQARHYSKGDLAVPLLLGFLFLHSPPHSPLFSLGLRSSFFFLFFSNPHLKRQCGDFCVINFSFPPLFVPQKDASKEVVTLGWIQDEGHEGTARVKHLLRMFGLWHPTYWHVFVSVRIFHWASVYMF